MNPMATPTKQPDCQASQDLGLPRDMLKTARLAHDERPLLLAVVDTEEEFDWAKPFSRSNRGVSWIDGFPRAHGVFTTTGMRPTYVIDYPVATNAEAVQAISRTVLRRESEVGAHLHCWVTPPETEEVTRRNSYQGNLPAELEWKKLCNLKSAIEQATSTTPISFKAGRFGLAPRTPEMLTRLGFRIDLSTTPGFDWSGDGGPDHSRAPNTSSWINTEPPILEIPSSGGFFGPFRGLGRYLYGPGNTPTRKRSGFRWALRKLGLLNLALLSPEGYSLTDLQKLTDQLIESGVNVLSLSLHSPSFHPGHTPFVRDGGDLDRFLKVIEDYARWFDRSHRGQFVTAKEALALHAPP
jgi:hypothetical protein